MAIRISTTSKLDGVRTFCTYLGMQSQQAAREGFDDAAEYIALILDDMLTLADA